MTTRHLLLVSVTGTLVFFGGLVLGLSIPIAPKPCPLATPLADDDLGMCLNTLEAMLPRDPAMGDGERDELLTAIDRLRAANDKAMGR